jgi:hypothetical protein
MYNVLLRHDALKSLYVRQIAGAAEPVARRARDYSVLCG